jgi:activating signal cointegrator complex subunit 3
LKNLINKSLEKLQRAGCIEYNKEDQSLMPTTLGYLASFYYLSHETIQHLGESIGPRTRLDELIGILS